jgi:hypothetical protein
MYICLKSNIKVLYLLNILLSEPIKHTESGGKVEIVLCGGNLLKEAINRFRQNSYGHI